MTESKQKPFFGWYYKKYSFWILTVFLFLFANWEIDFPMHLGYLVGQFIGFYLFFVLIYFGIYQFYKEGFKEGRNKN